MVKEWVIRYPILAVPLFILLGACGSTTLAPTPLKPKERATPKSPQVSTKVEETNQFYIRRIPKWGLPFRVAKRPIFVAGSFRFEFEDGKTKFATDILPTPIQLATFIPSTTGEGTWWFLDTTGQVWTSPSFLGALTLVPLETPASSIRGQGKDDFLVLTHDGRVLDAKSGSLVSGGGLADLVVKSAAMSGEQLFLEDVLGRKFVSRDYGATVQKNTSGPQSATRAVSYGAMNEEEQSAARRQAVERFPYLTNQRFQQLDDVPEGCRLVAEGVAQCNSRSWSVYAANSKRWVTAVDSLLHKGDFRPSTPSLDGKRRLFDAGCGGEFGQLCLVSTLSGERQHIPVHVQFRDIFGIVEDSILVGEPRASSIVKIDINTGKASSTTFDGEFSKFELLSDGVVFARGYRDGGFLIRNETVVEIAAPENTRDIRMLSAQYGIAKTQNRTLLSTKDGAKTWALAGTCSGSIHCDSKRECKCGDWVASIIPKEHNPAEVMNALARRVLSPLDCKLNGHHGRERAEPPMVSPAKKGVMVAVTWVHAGKKLKLSALAAGFVAGDAHALVIGGTANAVMLNVCTRASCSVFVGTVGKKKLRNVTNNGRLREMVPLENGDTLMVFDHTRVRKLGLLKKNGAFSMVSTFPGEPAGARLTKRGLEVLYRVQPRGRFGTPPPVEAERMVVVDAKGTTRLMMADVGTALHTPCTGSESGDAWIVFDAPSYTLENGGPSNITPGRSLVRLFGGNGCIERFDSDRDFSKLKSTNGELLGQLYEQKVVCKVGVPESRSRTKY